METFALQHYEGHGCKGCERFRVMQPLFLKFDMVHSRFHCEGRIVTTLFGLLFWSVIFAPIPGAFETPFQSAPLDLVEDTFFYSRQDLIEARLEEIRSGKAADILERVYDANTNVMCVGVRWDLFQKEDLLGIVRVSAGHVACCSALTDGWFAVYGQGRARRDMSPHVRGLWCASVGCPRFDRMERGRGLRQVRRSQGSWRHAAGEPEGECLLCTLKYVELTVSVKVWIDVLLQAGMPVEVCHVSEEGDDPKHKKGKAVKKEKTKKKAGKKRKRDDWLAESEDEEMDYSQLDKHTEDEADEAAAAPSPKKRRTRANAKADEPASPVARKVARVSSQVEVVITSTPTSSRHPSSSPSKSKGSPSKSKK